ncbi:MAG TPA: hypothetical protein VMB50_20925 [Myxococcales bacterium]|nr:hypothetical protein [Myxococcales bacterium]
MNEDGTKVQPLPGDGYNVQVFLDGCAGGESNDRAAMLWVTSVAICPAPTPGHLHWPQRA